MKKEYIVTLHNYDDLENFYDEMESKGSNGCIPDREVECASRRTISRNTHYFLTEEEANLLKDDPRVSGVSLTSSELGLEVTPHWSQQGNFEKSPSIDSNDKNWGLLRCVNGVQVSGWGLGGTFTQQSATIQVTNAGTNVDVVIVDAHINFNHPEFAVNSDGTGGSRAIQYNWFQHSSSLGFPITSTYTYSLISSNHGTHTAGTTAGNTQGWARSSNIYNIEFGGSYVTGTPQNWATYIFDFIRAFHKNKPINPVTKKRNPTIVNNSWGYSASLPVSSVQSVVIKGTTTSITGTNEEKRNKLISLGIPQSQIVLVNGQYIISSIPSRFDPVDADIQSAIADGIIMVGSAGNSNWFMDKVGGANYNDVILTGPNSGAYLSRGGTPGAATGMICVGAVGNTSTEEIASYSNYGPRVDIFAPGTAIVSSVFDTTASSEFGVPVVNDPRNSNYKLASISGTSMAGPQVTGILACFAPTSKKLNQAAALKYLTNSKAGASKAGQLSGTKITVGKSLNRYLYFYEKRPKTGAIAPVTFGTRDAGGLTFPRVDPTIYK